MSEFSDIFRGLIQEKDINVYSMVQYCNTDRSTMYKYISGKRKLKDLSLFKKIAEYMRLSPLEYQDFLQAYHISNIGEYTYYCRQNVENFILGFPENLSPPKPPKESYGPLPDYTPDTPCLPLHTQVEVNNYIYWMIHLESNIPHGHLGMLLQPDHGFLFHLLSSINPIQAPMRIDHIFCLNNSEQMTESKKIRFLCYMETIMPLFFAGLDYHPHYFYDDINAHFYNLNTFPYLLLTSTCALMCSSDFKRGIIYHDKQFLSFLWRSYEDIRTNTSPLFHIVNSVLEECDVLGNMGWGATPSYAIQAEPCLIPYITPAILDRAVPDQIPDRAALITNVRKYIEESLERIPDPNMHTYHTRQGILRFLETGFLQEIPADIYSPFTMEERLQMLGSMTKYSLAGIHRMLKGPLENLPLNLHLSFNAYNGYLLFSNHIGQNIYLIIEESGMLSAFMDYVSNLDENYICTPEETTLYIQQLINKYRNAPLSSEDTYFHRFR